MSIDVPTIAPRKPAKVATKGAPAPAPDAAAQLTNSHTDQPARDALIMVNFKETAAFRTDVKMYAAQHGMTMAEVFRQSFEAFKKANNGGSKKAKK